MSRKEFIELAIEAAKVFGSLHDKGILDAQDTVKVLGDCIVDALNEGYGDVNIEVTID
jgi:hypothetical protein